MRLARFCRQVSRSPNLLAENSELSRIDYRKLFDGGRLNILEGSGGEKNPKTKTSAKLKLHLRMENCCGRWIRALVEATPAGLLLFLQKCMEVVAKGIRLLEGPSARCYRRLSSPSLSTLGEDYVAAA